MRDINWDTDNVLYLVACELTNEGHTPMCSVKTSKGSPCSCHMNTGVLDPTRYGITMEQWIQEIKEWSRVKKLYPDE